MDGHLVHNDMKEKLGSVKPKFCLVKQISKVEKVELRQPNNFSKSNYVNKLQHSRKFHSLSKSNMHPYSKCNRN